MSERLHFVSKIAGAFVAAAGILVMLGWLADSPVLKSVAPSWATMKFNTALCFALAGLSLALPGAAGGPYAWVRRSAAVTLGLFAALTLLQWLLSVDFGLDELFFVPSGGSPGPVRSRMAPATALCFLLQAISLAALSRPTGKWKWAILPSALAGLLGLVALIGYLYGAQALYSITPYSSVAVHTALCLVVLTSGIVCARPDSAPVQLLIAEGVGGRLARLWFPLALGVPALLGWIGLQGQRAAWYNPDFGQALFAATITAFFCWLVWRTAQRLERVDQDLRQSESRYRQKIESIPHLVWTCLAEGPCDYLSPQWVAYTGVPEKPQLGAGWLEQVHPADRNRAIGRWQEAVASGRRFEVEFRIRRDDGSYRWFAARAEPLRDATGTVAKWFGTNTDIEERKQAEERAEAAAQEVLDLKFSLDEHCIVEITDPNGRITYVNENYCRISQYSRDELLGANPRIVNSGHHPKEFFGELWSTISQGRYWHGEIQNRAKDGSIYWVESTVVPFLDAWAKPRQYVAIHTDITARKAAEASLRAAHERTERTVRERTAELEEANHQLKRAKERLELAAHAGELGIWEWSVTDNRLDWDDTMFRLYGVGPEQFSGAYETWAKSVHPEDRAKAESDLAASVAGATDFSTSFRIIRPDGAIRHIEAAARLHRASAGHALHMVGLNRDVTERRRMESHLRASELLLREFVAHVPAAIAMLDTKMCYLQVSERWLIDYKLIGKEVIGRNHYELFPDVPQRWKEVHQRVLAGAVEACAEDPFPRAHGGTEWLQWEARPWRNSEGEIGGLIFFTQVITSRKEMELDLQRKKDELELSNRDLERFAYVASHDLQEPLRAVAGCTQILEQRYAHSLDPGAGELLQHIVEGAQRMQALVLDLLAYSRAGARPGEVRNVDSAEALHLALSNLKYAISQNDAEVIVGELPTLPADSVQLTQLFQNLISNALKYRSERRPRIAVECRKEGKMWLFSVSDNGIGIEAKYFERIFVLFQRLHTRAEHPGTGIGLSLCQKIVERHGGRIWVESTVGEGSVFKFALPADPAMLRA